MENIQLTTECLKAISNIGSTTYQNVCNGVITKVPWGVADWLGAIFLAVLTISALYMFRVMFKYLS